MYDHSTLAHAPDSHFLENKYSVVDARGLEEETGIVIEDKNEIMFDLRNKDFEGEKGSLPIDEKQDGDGIKKLPGLHDLVDMEDSLNVRENETRDSSTSCIPLGEVKLSDKEIEFSGDGIKKLTGLHDLVDMEDSLNVRENETRDSSTSCIPLGEVKLSDKEIEFSGDGIKKLTGLHDLVDMEDSLNVRENETRDSSTSCIPLGEVKLSDKEIEFYTDKSVTECELPDIICLKEGAHHVVKDIWIDDGLPSFDKILIQSGELHHKGFACDTEVKSELTKEIVQTAVPISDGTNPFLESECEMDDANKCESDHLLETGEGYVDARDEILAMIFDEKVNLDDKILVGECTNSSHNEPCNIDGDKADGDKANQDTCEEAKSVNSVASSAAEVSNCNQAIELPLNSEVESGSSTAYNVDSLPPTTSGREESPSTDCKPSVQTFNMLLCHEEDPLDSQAVSSRSFFIQHGHGEASFSSVGPMSGPMSGPISYSGPVPYSGSISLRSDSSTTSTRSFAFPVIHTEWNSSPVKMAKADRRNLRKQRGWRTSLLCCRF